jgi:hypothetical protein
VRENKYVFGGVFCITFLLFRLLMKKFFILPVALLTTTVVLAWCTKPTVEEATPQAIALASCLKDKGVVMYGTTRCVHCQNQKAMFGSAFDQVTFIDCDKDRAACTAANISWYPTWKDTSGSSFPGVQSLEQLSVIGGCDMQIDAMPVDDMPVNTMPVDTMPVDDMPVDTMPTEEIPSGELPADDTSGDEMPYTE